ncbi:hypothetical protein Tco_0317787 [Tanacetum coccineum]
MPKDSSNSDEVLQNVTFEIHHGGCFTATPSKSYISGQVLSVNVVDIDEFCLHDLKDMVVKLGYGVADLMYFNFLRPRLGLDYGLHPLNVDADALEMEKYVKDYKIILVYVEHRSSNIDTSIFVTFKKGFAIAVDNHLRKVETADPFEDLDEILGDYANTRDEITRKQMVVHVGNSSTVDDVLDLQMLFETKRLVILGSSKKWRWKQIMNQKKRHIVEDVHVSMNNFNFNVDPRHDLSIGAVEVQEHDINVIDYDSFGSDLDDGINSERRIQLRELRRIGKQKNKGPNKYYFYLGQQFATKEIVIGRVRKHSVETRRRLILVKNDKERVRIRCEGTIPALVPYVANDIDINKNVFSQIKDGPVIRENNISGKQNILGKDKIVKRKGPWPGQILTSVGVDANNRIYPVAYAIVEAESKAKGGVYKEMLWNAAKATPVGEFNQKMSELKSFNSAAYDWLMKISAEQWTRSYFSGRAKCDLLLNNIYEVFNRQLVDGKDQPIINCLEYIRVEMSLVVESATVIIPPIHKPQVGRPPKKRKKSYDEIASQSASSGKLSRKGKQAAGARNASSQTAGARQHSQAQQAKDQLNIVQDLVKVFRHQDQL